MTQRIETLNDIIEVLETDADVRRRVFEALGLPAYIGDAVITPLTERIDALGTELRSEMSDLGTELRSEMSEMRSDISGLRSDVDGLSSRVDGLRSDVDGLSSRVDGIRSEVADLRSVVAGDHFERAARSEVPVRLGEVLENPTGVRVIVSLVDGAGATDGMYRDGLRRAQDAGAIAPEDALRLSNTDLVLTATVNGEPHMVPVEVSATIDNEDITRALRSSELIREVFGVESVPVVAGPDIRLASRQYATEAGVGVIILNIDDFR